MGATPADTDRLYIGLMSGTSLDGVDGVLAAFPAQDGHHIATLASAYIPFDDSLRDALMALQRSGPDEIHREALVAAQLATLYAECVAQLRRHDKDAAIAAGGHGAPLVPAFHQAIFGVAEQTRVVVNIGGIGNISILPAAHRADAGKQTGGFDTGPGNALMDAWIARHMNKPYDENGAWAAGGVIHRDLLKALSDEAFFKQAAPKSTGRDLFHMQWLEQKLAPFGDLAAVDVQATLIALTANSIAQAIADYAPDVADVYVCGGGAYNGHLMASLAQALQSAIGRAPGVQSTAVLGVAPNHVEALAFAWLAQRFTQRLPGNVPAVTGAAGLRILGALYPA